MLDSRTKPGAIRRNGILVSGVVLLVALLFVQLSGLFSAETLVVFSAFFDLALRALVLLALVDGITRLETPSERRFWTLTLAAFSAWFIADIAFQPEGDRPLLLGLTEDAAFLLFYPLQLLAIEQRPGEYYWPVAPLGTRWLCAAAGVGLLLWSYFYLVGLPLLFHPEVFLTTAPSYFFYAAADFLLCLVLFRRAVADRGRWRIIQGLLGTGLLLWAACDLVDGLAIIEAVNVPYGTPLDVVWSLPHFAVVAAAVYRNRSAGAGEAVPAAMTENRSGLVSSTFGYACAIPIIHLVVFSSGWLSELEIARELTVTGGLLVLLAVAFTVQNRERRRRMAVREPRVLVLGDENQQVQKMEALGRLAGGVAHDFNNLLMILQSQIEIRSDQLVELVDGREFVTEVQKVIDRGSDLARQLLAFGRKQVARPRVLNPREVVADTESLLLRTLGEHVELEVEAAPEVWRVAVDPGQLSQVLINLALNAREAMPNGGRLAIRIRNVVVEDGAAAEDAVESSQFVQLEVADTGRGMDEETRRRIFEPFFTTRSSAGGTGLGLAVVYGVVKQNGGYLTCESAEDKGTIFRIHLPRATPADEQSLAVVDVPRRDPGGSETILLAEDEPSVRSLASEFLRSAGYEVLEASDGAEALDCAGSFDGPIHLLLTDIVMPKVGGLELAQRLAAERPSTAVLYVTGYPQDLPMTGREALQRSVLQKPYSLLELEAKVREILDRSEIPSASASAR